MNRKNPVLTVLACLNCMHTTHAVERLADGYVDPFKKDRYVFNANNDMFYFIRFGKMQSLTTRTMLSDPRKQSVLDVEDRDRATQYAELAFQKARTQIAQRLKNADMYKDARVKEAKTLMALDTKVQNNMGDNQDPIVTGVVQIRQRILDDLRNQNARLEDRLLGTPKLYYTGPTDHMSRRFEERLETLFRENNIQPPKTGSYEAALYKMYPQLNHKDVMVTIVEDLYPYEVFSLVDHGDLSYWDVQMHLLETTYPTVAKKMWDLCKKAWTQDLNAMIKTKRPMINPRGSLMRMINKINSDRTDRNNRIQNSGRTNFWHEALNHNKNQNGETTPIGEFLTSIIVNQLHDNIMHPGQNIDLHNATVDILRNNQDLLEWMREAEMKRKLPLRAYAFAKKANKGDRLLITYVPDNVLEYIVSKYL